MSFKHLELALQMKWIKCVKNMCWVLFSQVRQHNNSRLKCGNITFLSLWVETFFLIADMVLIPRDGSPATATTKIILSLWLSPPPLWILQSFLWSFQCWEPSCCVPDVVLHWCKLNCWLAQASSANLVMRLVGKEAQQSCGKVSREKDWVHLWGDDEEGGRSVPARSYAFFKSPK